MLADSYKSLVWSQYSSLQMTLHDEKHRRQVLWFRVYKRWWRVMVADTKSPVEEEQEASIMVLCMYVCMIIIWEQQHKKNNNNANNNNIHNKTIIKKFNEMIV